MVAHRVDFTIILFYCRDWVNGVKSQVLKNREKERERLAEEKRKQDQHTRIITQAGGFPPVPNTQATAALNHWQNSWSTKYSRPATVTSFVHFRPESTTSMSTGVPYYPLSHRESHGTVFRNSFSTVEPGSTGSRASVMSKLQGFKHIADAMKGKTVHVQPKPANLPSLKLMAGDLGDGAAKIAEANQKSKKKKKKSRKK